MLYSINTTADYSARVSIGAGISSRTNKEYIYCELTYHRPADHIYYTKTFPAAKFSKVCAVYHAINKGIIPTGEIIQTIKNIK